MISRSFVYYYSTAETWPVIRKNVVQTPSTQKTGQGGHTTVCATTRQ